MATSPDPRVAIYIDFDNIVISRYNQVHKRGQFQKDNARDFDPRRDAASDASGEIAQRIEEATVDLAAILDYASSFGTIAISRAYADWSVPVNAGYQDQLIERAVDLVQLFPVVASMKNGADIRLSVDVVEDLFRLPDLSHVVIVAGDSDYIALAQRAKLLGRHVVGIGVAGGTSRALAAACDEFADYDALPGVAPVVPKRAPAASAPAETAPEGRRRRRPKQPTPQEAAAALLVRALDLAKAKNDEDWQSSGSLKNQMLRMDPTFQERALGFSSFTDFVKSVDEVELDETHPSRRIRLVPTPG